MDYTVSLKKILSEKQLVFLQSLISCLKTLMSQELFGHSLGTFNCCIKMADRFLLNGPGSDSGKTAGQGDKILYNKNISDKYFKLSVAAVLHDYGKIYKYEELKEIAIRENLGINDFELDCKPILHSFVAPFLLKKYFKITDRIILNSVKIHTTGAVKMNIIDKILYISDKIEETRDYESVEKLRDLSLFDINLCLLEVYKSTIIYVIKGNNVLHPDTAKIWNYIQHGGLKNAT